MAGIQIVRLREMPDVQVSTYLAPLWFHISERNERQNARIGTILLSLAFTIAALPFGRKRE